MIKGSAPILEIATLLVVLLGCVVALVPGSEDYVLAMVRSDAPANRVESKPERERTRSTKMQTSKLPAIAVSTSLPTPKLPKATLELAPPEDWGSDSGDPLRIEPMNAPDTARDFGLVEQSSESPSEPLQVETAMEPTLDAVPTPPADSFEDDEWVRFEEGDEEPSDHLVRQENAVELLPAIANERTAESELQLKPLPSLERPELGSEENQNDFVPRRGVARASDQTGFDANFQFSDLPDPIAAKPQRSAASELKDMIRRFGVGGRVVANPTWNAATDSKATLRSDENSGSSPVSLARRQSNQKTPLSVQPAGEMLPLPPLDSSADPEKDNILGRRITSPGPLFRDLPPNE